MNISQSKKTAILRIINSEVRERNFDPESYREAVIHGLGDKNLIIKNYFRLRFKTLLSANEKVSERSRNKEAYVSTAQCATYVSSRNIDREMKTRKELSNSSQLLERFIANVVLVIGAASTIVALWVYNGNSFSTFFYILLLGVVSITLLLPSFLSKLNVCSYLSSLSIMCTLAAITSFGSGMKLMKDDPAKEVLLTEQKSEESVHTIQFSVNKNVNVKSSNEIAMD